MKADLSTKPRLFRSSVSRSTQSRVDISGGRFGSGLLSSVSVIARGEALGHDVWIDNAMLYSVADAINLADKGTKARFTHPSLSGDGAGKYLGRLTDARVDGDRVLADLHLASASRKTPDGDLGGYVMQLASEDASAFGMSIAFDYDIDAEQSFIQHHDDGGGFASPDPDNSRNLPHARMALLRAADVVDEPAANPDGLFHRGQDVAQEADAMLSYALGLTDQSPGINGLLNLDADRARGFVSRFLTNHNLELSSMDETTNTVDTNNIAAEDVEAEAETQAEPTNEVANTEPAASVEDTPGDAQLSAGQTAEPECRAVEGQRFIDAFGNEGAVWFAQGKSFDEANDLYTQHLKAQNEDLRKQLAAANDAEEGVAFGNGDVKKGRSLFAATSPDTQ